MEYLNIILVTIAAAAFAALAWLDGFKTGQSWRKRK